MDLRPFRLSLVADAHDEVRRAGEVCDRAWMHTWGHGQIAAELVRYLNIALAAPSYNIIFLSFHILFDCYFICDII